MSTKPPEPRPPSRADRVRPDLVRRQGARRHWFSDVYHHLLTTSWPRFFALVTALYLSTNALFAALYLLDPNGLEGGSGRPVLDAYFFSVQTMATIGYGKLTPRTPFANALVTIEALIGMLSTAMATGLMFAKFSRPTARVLFSKQCVIQERDGVSTLVFRMVNERATQIVEAQAHVVLLTDEVTREGERIRRLRDLSLVRANTPAFALSWMVFHPIDEQSPMRGWTARDFEAKNASILVSFMGLDESFNATVHVRKYYSYEDLVFDHRFVDILVEDDRGRVLDVERVHLIEPVPARLASATPPLNSSAQAVERDAERAALSDADQPPSG